ncbi:DUF397 domain-containing protein [Streptomyces griseocarneus]|nr:DUF397 domain-containing protein [Streptomyces griseocarneus]
MSTEIGTPALEIPDAASWFKASYSTNSGANCVSVAELTEQIAIRDSKQPAGPIFAVPTTVWAHFVHEA